MGNKFMKTGISLYFSNGVERNEAIIRKARKAGIKYAFTSMHIPEETGIDYRRDARKLLEQCRDAGINLIVDVSPVTLEKLGCASFDELLSLGITYIRLDFGFTAEETVALSEKFHIVFNASTISQEDIQNWAAAGADFTRFAACHNYYPKPYTGLSLDRVKEMNQRLKILGFTTMAFVPGNSELRGPLCEGLPTVEEHRFSRDEVLLHMLELYQSDSDIVLVGDNDVTEEVWTQLAALSKGYVALHADILPGYEFERAIIHHDRPDSSEYVIRSQESRFNCRDRVIAADTAGELSGQRLAGKICIANEAYLRYMGELEICRVDMPSDPRVNVIGQVAGKDRKYLPYIREGMGFYLCPADGQ